MCLYGCKRFWTKFLPIFQNFFLAACWTRASPRHYNFRLAVIAAGRLLKESRMKANARLSIAGRSTYLLSLALTSVGAVAGLGQGLYSGAWAQGLPTKEQIQADVDRSMSAFLAYDSPKGFRIKYPKSWEPAAPQQGLIACKFRSLKGLVSVRVAVEDLPPGTNMETYSKATLIGVNKFMSSKNMPISILAESGTNLGAAPAFQTLYSYKVTGTQLTAKVLQITAVKNGKGYCFNYTAGDATLYDDYIKVVAEMAKSIEWL
jgi:hypothetical protein